VPGAPHAGARMTPEEVERGYNNRAAVPDHPAWFARFAAASQEAIAALSPRLDVRYGRGAKETLDLFLPSGTPRGTLAFIHGGYWRSLDKAEHAFVAPAFVAQGLAVANINYDLCPAVTVADIVAQATRAIALLDRDSTRLGLAGPLVVAGHSAGGHLATMAVSTSAAAYGTDAHPVRAALSLSGVHDLTPLLLSSMNADLRLDLDAARASSPALLRPATSAPVAIVVGADETSEFLRQSDLLFGAWPANRPAGMPAPLRVPGRHHFNVVMDYVDGDSALTRTTLALF
jgi:arylformamidase